MSRNAPRSGELRRDPVSGRLVVLAPGRGHRPGAPQGLREPVTPAELESCPFCEGREGRTPPETLALAPAERAPDTAGWSVRVVPNLYPAFRRQEVVVHSPRHARSLGELSPNELALVAEAWSARARVAERDGFAYLHTLVNEGRAAGASLDHSHSQLVPLEQEPPEPARDRVGRRSTLECELCALLRGEREAGLRIVAERDGIVALCPPAGRLPYELLIAPARHVAEPWGDERLAVALQVLGEAWRGLFALEGSRPVNAWLHAAPFGGDGHWHLESVPRLSVLAGIELGAGIYVNTLAPEEAAAALRGVGA